MSAERIVGAGRGASDGVGLEISSPTNTVSKGSVAGPVDPDARPALYETGGVLVNSTSSTVEIGTGNQRDSMLAVLFLYQQLPQLVPKTQIEFRGALGQTVMKTIELKNPSRRAITYHVTLDASVEYVN